jgi:hypothetical protein
MTMSENRQFMGDMSAKIYSWNCLVGKSVIALCRAETLVLMA